MTTFLQLLAFVFLPIVLFCLPAAWFGRRQLKVVNDRWALAGEELGLDARPESLFEWRSVISARYQKLSGTIDGFDVEVFERRHGRYGRLVHTHIVVGCPPANVKFSLRSVERRLKPSFVSGNVAGTRSVEEVMSIKTASVEDFRATYLTPERRQSWARLAARSERAEVTHTGVERVVGLKIVVLARKIEAVQVAVDAARLV